MSILQFHAPPLPHFTMGGQDTYEIGGTHPNRKNIGLFDVLLVTQGCLFLCEESTEYEITPGKVAILRPDRMHYTYKPCSAKTHFYWLHFQTIGEWNEIHSEHQPMYTPPNDPYKPISFFSLYLPRLCALANPWETHRKVVQLLELQQSAQELWRQQVMFQEIMMDLNSRQMEMWNSHAYRIAERTAAFLRQNYKNEITNETLHLQFHFHPTYLARCMKQVYGCTPLDYLTDFRIRQAKQLLVRTDLSVDRIASQVGFNSSTYFIRRFSKAENVTPRAFRKHYR